MSIKRNDKKKLVLNDYKVKFFLGNKSFPK